MSNHDVDLLKLTITGLNYVKKRSEGEAVATLTDAEERVREEIRALESESQKEDNRD